MYFSLLSMIFPLFFLVIFGVILFSIIGGVRTWSSNNKEPVLTVAAEVVSKRTNHSNHNHNHENHIHTTTDTTYYITFQVESGDRMEFRVNGKEYGGIVEGDLGKLTFQGTRYHGFERIY